MSLTLAAASCCKLQQIPHQPVWQEIADARPDALLLLGDNVYLDHDRHDDPAELGDELAARYRAQREEPHFRALLDTMRSRGAPVLPIYDDHDFLGNNRYGGDVGPALREAARRAFVAAFEPARTGADVYALHALGLVDVLVLDARFYRRAPAVSAGDRDAVLGQAQWNWLEKTLQERRDAARYTVVASSTTLHRFGDESWEDYPAAFQRLVRLLRRRPGTLLLSGDVHRNAVYDDSGVIEIVTSAVARNGTLFGAPRRNYGLLHFDETGVRVDLHSLKAGWRFDFRIPREPWTLP